MWRMPALLQRPQGVISARKPAKTRMKRFETAKMSIGVEGEAFKTPGV
jgi:hypothetical protein